MIIDLHLSGLVAEFLAEALEISQVLFAKLLGIDEQLVIADLQVAELSPLLERKVKLLGSDYVEKKDLVAPVAEMPQRPRQRSDLVEAVGENHDQAAPRKLSRQLVPE